MRARPYGSPHQSSNDDASCQIHPSRNSRVKAGPWQNFPDRTRSALQSSGSVPQKRPTFPPSTSRPPVLRPSPPSRPRDIRFDIQHGSAVKQIRLVHKQRKAFYFQESYATEPNRVRTVWAPACKSPHAVTALRRYRRARRRAPTFVFVELENHPKAFKAIEVAERRLEVTTRIEFNASRMPSKKTPLSGSVIFVDRIAAKCSDRIHFHIQPSTPMQPLPLHW